MKTGLSPSVVSLLARLEPYTAHFLLRHGLWQHWHKETICLLPLVGLAGQVILTINAGNLCFRTKTHLIFRVALAELGFLKKLG